MAQQRHAGFAVVEARDCGEIVSAVMAENLGVLARDLLERLQAVGREARRHHREILHAALGEPFDGGVRVGFEPFRRAEPRLEGHQEAVLIELEPRRGNCSDNAFIESFWSSLKYELVYHHRFATLAQARTAVFDYIETFYNRIRLHSSLAYLSPINFESKLT